ncbi:hypothetical protein NQ317_015568 [Molorchus minor]|uniref:Uncharacterized protein n=1 Tax=Molorchus minor TaxID=1323400 RepID=A0ABQ9JGE3_9CUCU|nr:hypothetical protein NQ317_015568 [Molorchus minor]
MDQRLPGEKRLLPTVLNVIIGKQFFPRYYRLQVNPATPRERRVQAHLELAELVEDPRTLTCYAEIGHTIGFLLPGIGIERSSDRILSLTICCVNCIPLTDAALLQILNEAQDHSRGYVILNMQTIRYICRSLTGQKRDDIGHRT